mgnify:CR=1 FL=1
MRSFMRKLRQTNANALVVSPFQKKTSAFALVFSKLEKRAQMRSWVEVNGKTSANALVSRKVRRNERICARFQEP